MYITKEPLSGNFKSKFILIKDSIEVNGIKLLKSFLNTFLKENVKLHIVYYELRNFELVCNDNVVNNVSQSDAVSDPFFWNESNEKCPNFMQLSALSEFCSEFKGVICFDSLTPLLIYNDTNNVYKTLHKILKENSQLQIITLMHTDVHDSFENEIMEKLATTVLDIIPNEDKCFSTVRYSSGKVKSQLIEYKISENFEILLMREIQTQIKPSSAKQPDPTANLTFNLRLKENEKHARSQIQLPYLQVQEKDNEVELDMYDEEDPDDDLDI